MSKRFQMRDECRVRTRGLRAVVFLASLVAAGCAEGRSAHGKDARTPADAGTEPRDGSPTPDAATLAAWAGCRAKHETGLRGGFDLISADEAEHPWFAAGPPMKFSQEGTVSAIESGEVTLSLFSETRTIVLIGLGPRLPVTAGQPLWVDAESTGGYPFEPRAFYIVLRSAKDEEPIAAVYAGDLGLLSAGFAAALGVSTIDVADVCTYVEDPGCFDDQHITVLQLTLVGDAELRIESGFTGTLALHGREYSVSVPTAVRTEDGASRCFDAIFGSYVELSVTR